MRKRKGVRSASAIEEEGEEAVQVQEQDNGKNESEGCEGNGFFACYLLASLNPRFKGHTYIGFTVNPRRRIRQHNGEIGSGAWRTKKRRPWEMVLCIYGFPTNVSALQFEWAWQHPVESLAVRKAAVNFKSLSGIANKIKLAYTMLTLPSWQNMNMTVHFFSTKYMKHCGGCPNLPEHMKVETGSMDELPCYTERIDGLSENEEDEVEFNNNASTSGSVPDPSDDSLTPDSPKSPNHGDKISEAFGWSKESEAREPPGHPFTTENPSLSFGFITTTPVKSSPVVSSKRVGTITENPSQSFGLITTTPVKSSPVVSSKRVGTITENPSQSFGLITTTPVKSSPVPSSKRVEIIEDADLLNVMNKSDDELSQPESVKSDAADVNSTFIVPLEAEIVDLSTPSPSWRNIIDRKKRRVSSSVGANFIDLTKSPNFVQL